MTIEQELQSEAKGYKDGYKAGFASGFTEGNVAGYAECKARSWAVVDILQQYSSMTTTIRETVSNVLANAIGRQA